VVGIDLAADHAHAARAAASHAASSPAIVQGDVGAPPFLPATFDLIWSANTVNHLRHPAAGLAALGDVLRPGGYLVVGQSGFLPEMLFAWDERLEREVSAAIRRYYYAKYGLDARDVAGLRGLVGLLRGTGFSDVSARTIVIERIAPFDDATARYLESVLGWMRGERLRAYLAPEDWAELQRLCDSASADYCVLRPDFHHAQTLTLVTGRAQAGEAHDDRPTRNANWFIAR
jgi:SAM-dependent methyltransferase